MVIDLHTHILPERWPSWTERTGYAGWIELAHTSPGCAQMGRTTSTEPGAPTEFFREVRANCWDPRVRLEEMHAAGVEAQVLSTVPVMFSYWARPGDALDLSRLLNDHIAGIVRSYPGRFAGLGTVPMQDPDLACREMERCVRQLGLAGVQIGTHVNGANLDESAPVQVLQCAERLGAAVFVHPWDMLGGDRLKRYWMAWLVGMPTETTTAIMSVIFGGVLDRCPALRVAFAHAGGSFPGTLGRIRHGLACRPDLFPRNARDPSEYLRDPARGRPARFWIDALTHDADSLRTAVRLFGVERVALGSDYPFPLGEERPGAMIRSMEDFDEEARTWLLARAALEFLGPAAGSALARAAGYPQLSCDQSHPEP
jgi:aminocarboxymuconate-semialdehyde decarboxylase